jgi:hypothetical protein
MRAGLIEPPEVRAVPTLAEWCDGLGNSKRTLDRAKRSLQVVTYRPKVPGPWLWRLPDNIAKIAKFPQQLGNLGNLAENKGISMDFGPGQPNIAKIAKFPQQLGNLGNLGNVGNLGPEDAGSPSEDTADDLIL